MANVLARALVAMDLDLFSLSSFPLTTNCKPKLFLPWKENYLSPTHFLIMKHAPVSRVFPKMKFPLECITPLSQNQNSHYRIRILLKTVTG
jgi:hypothetical protein